MIASIIDNTQLAKFVELVAGVNRIVITCHKKADGDAIGSSLAFCRVLCNMGKNAIVILPDTLPSTLEFAVMGMEYVTFTRNEVKATNIIRNTQMIIALDYNTFSRTEAMAPWLEQAMVPKVLIDHHLDPDNVFDVAISHPEMSSTCELIYRLIMQAGWNEYMDKIVASQLFVGIMTDTGNLAFSSSYPEVYEIMAQLMRYGIDKPYLYKMAIDTLPLNSLLLQSYALLHRMTIIDDSIALITLDKEDLEKYNYKTGDTERLVNRPLSVREVYWSTFMREDPNCIKVSMRSEGDFSVDGLCAKYFGGGGHKHAAAGEFFGTMEEAVALFHTIVENIKNKSDI